MNFYSTYYKNQANTIQIQAMKEIFEGLDTNGDKALNKNELANIFSGQNLTQDEKALLMMGLDSDDDGFLTYMEFTPTFLEFDIDRDAEISGDEYDLVKKRLEELEKQSDINEQYAILNNLTSTEQEKNKANQNILLFKSERQVIYLDMDIQKKGILISSKDSKIQEIQDFINNNTLLEYEEAVKLKEIENLEVDKEILNLERDISLKNKAFREIEVDLIDIAIQVIEALENGAGPQSDIIKELGNQSCVKAQELISAEQQINISERNLELHHKQARIDEKESLLKKFFVPEPLKELARQELDLLYDDKLLLNHRIDLYGKVSALAETRAELKEKIYARNTSEDPDEIAQLQQQIDQLEADEDLQKLEATIASRKVELVDKQIQLKAVIPKSNFKPFDQVRATLESEIAALEAEIATLESQLS